MGGKTWSFEEERFFWHEIVPQSPKAVNPVNRILDWEMCARQMQAAMGSQARRRYTKLMLFEHYFQNVSTGHMSPHALAFVNEHKEQQSAEAQPAKETPGDSKKDTDADRSNIQHTVTERPALQVATVSYAPTAVGLPPARDHRQLPRLEIPASHFQQPGLSASSSTPGSGSYHHSPSAELPNFWPIPPHLVIPSQASLLYGYEPRPTYSLSGSGRAPMAPMMSIEPSPISPCFNPMPSSSHHMISSEPLAPSQGSKRKIEDAMGHDVYPYAQKRTLLPSQSYHLDTLATAASMDYTAGTSGIPVNFTANQPASILPANMPYLTTTPRTTPPTSGELSPVDASQESHAQIQDGSAFNSWTS